MKLAAASHFPSASAAAFLDSRPLPHGDLCPSQSAAVCLLLDQSQGEYQLSATLEQWY